MTENTQDPLQSFPHHRLAPTRKLRAENAETPQLDAVHIAITRQVKPGMEKTFEAALRKFARDSLREPGTTGVHLIGPGPGSMSREYGIL